MKVWEVIAQVLGNISKERTPKIFPEVEKRNVLMNELSKNFSQFIDGIVKDIVIKDSNIFKNLIKDNVDKAEINSFNNISNILPRSVDLLHEGQGDMEVTGVIVTFTATVQVIKYAISNNINFIITHEPTYYNHLDEDEWLKNDSVYKEKKKLIDENNIAIWRFHDLIHYFNPDFISEGLILKLGLEKYLVRHDGLQVLMNYETTIDSMIEILRKKLGGKNLKIIGNKDIKVNKIAFMVGKQDGRSIINYIEANNVELAICGEISEWEVSEYIRDAVQLGLRRNLIVIGHEESEEPGIELFGYWLKNKLPNENIKYVNCGSPFIGKTH